MAAYARADQLADPREQCRVDLVSARVRQHGDLSASIPELSSELFGHGRGDHAVTVTVGDDHQLAGQVDGRRFGVRNHRRQQHGTRQHLGPLQERRRRDVGPVGEPDRDQRSVSIP